MSQNDAILMLNAHLDYLGRIDDYIQGNIPDPKSATFETCILGKWYYGDAQADAKYNQLPLFGELGETHKHFHVVTDKAIALFREGKKEEAEALLSQAYTIYSKISNMLMSLDETFNA